MPIFGLSAIGDFRGQASLGNWLNGITLNEARGCPTTDLSAMNEVSIRIIPFPNLTEVPDPEAETVRAEMRRFLQQAIDTLPDDFRLVPGSHWPRRISGKRCPWTSTRTRITSRFCNLRG